MATNRTGKSARELAEHRRKTGTAVILVILAVVSCLSLVIFNSNALGIGGAGVFMLLLVIHITADWAEGFDRRSTRAEKRTVRGAVGEEEIGSLLDTLGDDFFVLHDISSPYGNIDHIVISRESGLFLIETKSHHGKVQVDENRLFINGKSPEKNFISQTLKNTFWLKDEIKTHLGLDIWISPVLVFSNAFVPYIKPVKGVSIINKRYLLNILNKPHKSGSANRRLWDERFNLADHLQGQLFHHLPVVHT